MKVGKREGDSCSCSYKIWHLKKDCCSSSFLILAAAASSQTFWADKYGKVVLVLNYCIACHHYLRVGIVFQPAVPENQKVNLDLTRCQLSSKLLCCPSVSWLVFWFWNLQVYLWETQFGESTAVSETGEWVIITNIIVPFAINPSDSRTFFF